MDYTFMDSPCGKLMLAGEGGNLSILAFWNTQRALYESKLPSWRPELKSFKVALSQLNDYFAGRRRDFDLSLVIQGTDFQQQVYHALMQIPYGKTCTYGQIAKTIGNPKAVRAVGSANNRNKLPIIVPCHRVVGKGGSLVGYSAGLEVKQSLLNLEGADT